MDVARDRLFAHVFWGGEVPDIDSEEDERGVPGVDFPVEVNAVDWISRRR